MLDFYVGDTAKKQIEQNGITPELFTTFLGASGGPKWFSLFGLDKYLFGEFFKDRVQPLDMLGSSAGAFRTACFAQKDPVKAITELATRYSETDFSDKVTALELTQMAENMMTHIFSQEGLQQIKNNPIFRPHFIVAKANGLVSFENKLLQGVGLASSIILNKISRRNLNLQYQRFVFKPKSSDIKIEDPFQINTQYLNFSEQNIKPALLASGAIPYVMAGIPNIPGAPTGMYRDGGVIDYHFDLQLNSSGLTLYPHFNKYPKAGWFDKNLSRNASKKSYDRTLMLVPSDQFIANLPHQKIPDRKDFETLPYQQRLSYWRTVFKETERLAEEFDRVISAQDLSVLKPLPF